MRAAPERDVLDNGRSTDRVRLEVMELDEPALRTAAVRPDERTRRRVSRNVAKGSLKAAGSLCAIFSGKGDAEGISRVDRVAQRLLAGMKWACYKGE